MRKKELIKRLYELEAEVDILKKGVADGQPFLAMVSEGSLLRNWPAQIPFPRIDNISIVKVVEKILKHLNLRLKVTPSKDKSVELISIEVKNPMKGK